MENLYSADVADHKGREVVLNYGPNVDVDFLYQRAIDRPSLFGRTSVNQCSTTGFLTLCALAVGFARSELIEFYDRYTGLNPPDFVLEPLQVFMNYPEPLCFRDPSHERPIDFGVRADLLVVKSYQWGTPETGLAFNTGGFGNYAVRRDPDTDALLAERIIPNELINYRKLSPGPYLPDFGIKPEFDAGMHLRQIFYNSLRTVAPDGMYDVNYIIEGLIRYGCPIDLSELTYTESRHQRMTLD